MTLDHFHFVLRQGEGVCTGRQQTDPKQALALDPSDIWAKFEPLPKSFSAMSKTKKQKENPASHLKDHNAASLLSKTPAIIKVTDQILAICCG